MKPWWQYLMDFFAGMSTKQDLARAGAGSDALNGAVTVNVDLPSGFNRENEEAWQRAQIVQFMRAQLGEAYKLGVEVATGHEAEAELWDCSESVEAAYRTAGKYIPDGSPFQYDYCRPVKRPLPGDLFFLWSDKWHRIGHVMVCTGEGTVVHAVVGRGVVEDPMSMWEHHARGRGWRRHPDFSRPAEDRA